MLDQAIEGDAPDDALAASRPVLGATGVDKRFGPTWALRDASLAVRAGEVHALVGANGAGKSTLVKVLSGAHAPDRGELVVGGWSGGRTTTRAAHEHGLATIYQDPSLVPTMNVVDNVMLGDERTRGGIFLDRRAQRLTAATSLSRVGLASAARTLAGALSPAQQQLLEIAKALHRRARAVIMDEPTAALGDDERRRLFAVIDDLRRDGVAVLFISHHLDEVLHVCDRVTVMRNGTTVATHRTDELDEQRLVELMIGHPLTPLPVSDTAAGRVMLDVRGLGQGARLHDVDLTLRAGEVVGITGLAGSGRSRLARVLFGAERHDAGAMHLDGESYRPRSPHEAIARGVGLVPEDRKRDGLLLHRSAVDNLTLCRLPTRGPGVLRMRARRAAARELVDRFAIVPADLDAPLGTFSGGNQQKVAVAKWIHAGATILILDEPGQAVDIAAKEAIFRAIRELADEGRAVLVISQELEELRQLVDRLVVMRRGTVVGQLGRDEITEERVVALSMGTAQHVGKESDGV